MTRRNSNIFILTITAGRHRKPIHLPCQLSVLRPFHCKCASCVTSRTADPPQTRDEFSHVQRIGRRLRPEAEDATCWERSASVIVSVLAHQVIKETGWPIYLVEMKKPRIPKQRRSKGAQKVPNPLLSTVFGLVGLLVMAIALFAGPSPANPSAPRPRGPAAVGTVRYVRSGQLAADARTAWSMVKWLLDFQPDLVPTLTPGGPVPIVSSSLATHDGTRHPLRN